MSGGQFSGKVVLVTGASSGIGKAVALEFASRGAMVCLGGRDESRLQTAMRACVEVSKEPSRFLIVRGDVTESSVRKEILEQTMDTFGRLDVLVANAGIIDMADNIHNLTEDVFDRIININLKSVVFLIQEAVPHLEKSKGCVISTSSNFSTVVNPQFFTYSLGKAALEHMTRQLAFALGPKGIRVNCVKAGLITTEIVEVLHPDVKAGLVTLNGWQPLKGRPGTPEELAYVFAMLASDVAGFITGQCVTVDGGNSLMGLNWTRKLAEGEISLPPSS